MRTAGGTEGWARLQTSYLQTAEGGSLLLSGAQEPIGAQNTAAVVTQDRGSNWWEQGQEESGQAAAEVMANGHELVWMASRTCDGHTWATKR